MKELKISEKESVKEDEFFGTFQTTIKTVIKNINYKKLIKIYSISLLLFLTSYILYKVSLTGCKKTEYECLTEERIKFFYKLGFVELISTIFFSVLIKYLLKHKKYILLIIYSLIFLNQVFAHQGENMEHHGRFNRIGFFFFLGCCFFVIKIFDYFYKQIKEKKYKKTIIIFSITSIIIISFLIIHRKACNNFHVGLGGYKVINNKSEDACYLRKPKTCDLPIWSKISLFDYSRFIKTCKNKLNDKKTFINYLNILNPNLTVTNNKYYFPNLNIFSFKESDMNVINSNVLKNVTTELKEGTHDQVWISFDKEDKGNINIEIPYNKSLVKEKRKIAKKNEVKFENVYALYIDSLSRQHFIRKLKKTSKLLDYLIRNRHMKVHDDYYSIFGMDNNINVYQLLKYQSLNYNTPPNYGPMFFGINPFSPNQSTSIMEQFANKGFITANIINGCQREAYNIVPNFYHVNFYSFDYDGSAMFCDPHFFIQTDIYSVFAGINSKFRRCFYNKDTAEYMFEYILKFLETYKHERKFVRLISNDAHEGTGEVVKYIDKALHSFLLEILTKYYDDKTLIIFLSDHGCSLAGAYELMLSEDKIFEKALGFLFVFLPKKSKYNNIVEYNEQRFVTPYDIFGTFIDVLYPKGDKPSFYFNGQSLLEKINGLERTCEKYDELRGASFCRCSNY